jgi:hypothetical protein
MSINCTRARERVNCEFKRDLARSKCLPDPAYDCFVLTSLPAEQQPGPSFSLLFQKFSAPSMLLTDLFGEVR